MRRNFGSSRLVRLLGDLAIVDAEPSRQDFAERLSLWLDGFDAVTLDAAHQSVRAVNEDRPARFGPVAPAALQTQVHRVRAALVKAILANHRGQNGPGVPNPWLPAGAPSATVAETDVPFTTYRQHYLELQRHMASQVGTLRAALRQALSGASPSLRQLAALDAVWEQVLGERMQKQLASVPRLLERRFENLRGATQQPDPALGHPPGGWLDTFDKDMRQVLLAEMEMRLEPVIGLLDALMNTPWTRSSNEITKYQ